MRKAFIFFIVVVMVTAMFACSKSEKPGPASSSPQETVTPASNEGDQQETPPAEDEGPYNFAAGKYETDSNGVPTEFYTYDLPLSTTDEVFTYTWLCMIPNYIPEEGYETMEFPMAVRERLGVNLEYDVVTFANASENFSTRLASDALSDMTYCAIVLQGIETGSNREGFFVNL
jgi:hypothetical protein